MTVEEDNNQEEFRISVSSFGMAAVWQPAIACQSWNCWIPDDVGGGGGGGGARRCGVTAAVAVETVHCDDSKIESLSINRRRQEHKRPMPVTAQHEHLSAQALASRIRRVTCLAEGQHVHTHILGIGLDQDPFLANLLISMYRRFGALGKACEVFDHLQYPGVVNWNNIITAHSKLGSAKEALGLFQQMLQRGCKPNRVTFISVLSACTSPGTLAEGKWIHAYAVKEGLKSDTGVRNALITMYNKCGDVKEALALFEKTKHRDVITWNSMIATFCNHKLGKEALQLFRKMQEQGFNADRATFVSLLNAFASPEDLTEACTVHDFVIDHGFHTDIIVGNALINMYNKCGAVYKSFSVFEGMPAQDCISWTTMIGAYAHHGHGNNALELFHEMQQCGCKPNELTFRNVLTACAELRDLKEGKAVHAMVKDYGLLPDVSLGNALCHMYGKCGAVKDARAVFDEMPVLDAVSWSIMLHVYSLHGHAKEVLQLFGEMQNKSLEPDHWHLISVLNACGILSALEAGKAVHEYISDKGFHTNITLGNALICMYSRCGALEEAHNVFDRMRRHDVISWNTLISADVLNDSYEDAFCCLLEMQKQGIEPDKVTFICVLRACTCPETLIEARAAHSSIIEHGFEGDSNIECSLINTYGKCGTIEDARCVFDHMQLPDVASWNAIMSAYCDHGNGQEVFHLIRLMHHQHISPDKYTFSTILKACCIVGAPEMGRYTHAMLMEVGLETDIFIVAALVNFYGKLKALKEARAVFDRVHSLSVFVWTAMIGAYAQCGCYDEAEQLLGLMEQKGVEPTKITFVSLLSSCDSSSALEVGKAIHSSIICRALESDVIVGNALVSMYGKGRACQDARRAFDSMVQHDVISWTAILDAYNRSGYVDEVFHLYEDMQQEKVKPNESTFIVLLGASTSIKLLGKGREIHANIVETGLVLGDVMKHALTTMYRACGAVEEVDLLSV